MPIKMLFERKQIKQKKTFLFTSKFFIEKDLLLLL